MIIGIVGSEAAKFTRAGEAEAKCVIASLLSGVRVLEVVSGGCHLGGIDQWAAEIGHDKGLIVTEFLPKKRSWVAGYKPRNLKIAQHCHELHCITVDALPANYRGMTFKLCYHCGTNDHIKSGGCWTMREAIKMGKRGQLHIIHQEVAKVA